MRKFAVIAYIAGVVSLAVLALGLLSLGPSVELAIAHFPGLVALFALGVLAERLSVPLPMGQTRGGHSVFFLLLLASVLLFGPLPTTALAFATLVVGETLVKRAEFRRVVFNVAQYVLAVTLAGWAFEELGGIATPEALDFSIWPFIGFAVVFQCVNVAAVAGVVALDQGVSFPSVVSRLTGRWGANLSQDFLVSPLAVLIAYTYSEIGWGGLLGISFLLIWVRRSYLIGFQLQQANRDLLKALVKAIETRDPYTSGHSMRVAALARRIASQMGLTGRSLEDVETAALLHDVGKIDAIYTDILSKKGSLSSEEMEVIKSHVDKGVELLTSLSSFHKGIIASVRHHHERYDGSGYPDGIAGESIPIGARIIKACDAVDAMLSDRPYRKALSLNDVREQLLLFSEREFDPILVSLFLKEGVLESHSRDVSRGKVATDGAREVSKQKNAVAPVLSA